MKITTEACMTAVHKTSVTLPGNLSMINTLFDSEAEHTKTSNLEVSYAL